MLTIKGEVRKVVNSDYVKKSSGELVKQAIVILEPETERNNYEVFLTADHIKQGLVDLYTKCKGKVVSIPVELFVSHPYKFHKFTASGTGKPISI